MTAANYQTIRLGRGKHRTPADGACVMELASMLGGEPFSDHPVSVCPVIGAFLRRYNDAIDDRQRCDLYRYAAKVVESRASAGVEHARADRLHAWTVELRQRRRTWSLVPRSWSAAASANLRDPEGKADRAIREVARHRGRIHREVLALVDELLAIGTVDGALAARPAPYGALATDATVGTSPGPPIVP